MASWYCIYAFSLLWAWTQLVIFKSDNPWLLFYYERIAALGTLRWRLKSPASRLLLNCFFRRRSKKTSKLCVTGLCAGNSPGTGEFPAQMASNAENVSIWWRHHERRKKAVRGVRLKNGSLHNKTNNSELKCFIVQPRWCKMRSDEMQLDEQRGEWDKIVG